MTMKKLEEMGLVPLTKKESVEENGGNSTIPPVKLPDILDNGSIWWAMVQKEISSVQNWKEAF